MERLYLDANVFIFAALNDGEYGEYARKLIKDIIELKFEAFTSTLTFDEVVWRIRKEKSLVASIEAGFGILVLPNLIFIDVTKDILWSAYDTMLKHKIKPRDAIHAACALSKGIKTIISEDPDFDKIPGLKRKG